MGITLFLYYHSHNIYYVIIPPDNDSTADNKLSNCISWVLLKSINKIFLFAFLQIVLFNCCKFALFINVISFVCLKYNHLKNVLFPEFLL